MALMLCFVALWRIMLLALVMAFIYVYVPSAMFQGNHLAIELPPGTLITIRGFFLGCAFVILIAAALAGCNAYRVYLKLYPRFVRGGKDAVALYWFTTEHHNGCPEGGFRVAAFLATK